MYEAQTELEQFIRTTLSTTEGILAALREASIKARNGYGGCDCPIALLVKHKFGIAPSVSRVEIFQYDLGHIFNLPEPLQKFIVAMDKGVYPEFVDNMAFQDMKLKFPILV